MTDAEYYRAKAAFEAQRVGRFGMNILIAMCLPFAMLLIVPYFALKLIYYIGGIAGIAATSTGREVIKKYLNTPEFQQSDRGAADEPNLANGFNPDIDSDWVGAAQVRRETRILR